ncbi:MAG: GNAT family N-acetyltransferase [Candidatus Diapherotrites archaeon]|uniref:GNAT family N-acetyltransferase n=1 Tax=Candidatus Iainarchaeum sp. TaxID=3101447 RepID=A0A938YXH4_9ARCH|nr:GNAT family N-acetyltransferase [Candidatus Diapherotrites archaeon]
MAEHVLRHAEHKDLERLIELVHQLSPPKPHEANVSNGQLRCILDNLIKDDNYHVCVLEKEGRVLATATLLLQMNLSHGGRPFGHIENVVVDTKQRGQGLGKVIIDHLLEKAREKNCYKVVLSCKKDLNVPFYAKCGLKESGQVEMRLDL